MGEPVVTEKDQTERPGANVLKLAATVAEGVGFAGLGVAGLITLLVKKATAETEAASNISGVDAVRLEAERQHFTLRMAELQAKVAQEVAIAHRIEVAQEVEIEEFYDASGEGHVGIHANPETLGFGAGGAGRKVTRRVIRFKGFALASESPG
jgi:hypothetical protein